MSKTPLPGPDTLATVFNPMTLAREAGEYALDAWQRSCLYADVRRRRGNQYREHLQEQVPHVLNFAYEPVLSGRDLPRPVNYWLVRIVPPQDSPTDPQMRPFVVFDPRAGHGPGIGGFKADSEIGAALKAGHPCYFVGFLPDPVPGQTIEDVTRAQAAFVRKVGELHPDSKGKPAVIGNCQAGWQILMAAALWPDLFGPIIVAGAPLSYWAGDTPMRYAGGLLGGSWMTAMTSDLGHGRFDGAWLVRNFENLDPANTLWSKQYKLYAEVDTEAERYLAFEKYWGGHVFLNDVEMQWVVDNLFIGNKLSSAQLLTSDGVRIDLRNIRSPILVFCSYGDNITPPAQALGWITDLYHDDGDVLSHNQTIVFATHDSIGHLGIFVSGSVGSKEHRKFASAIDQIDLLPAGIYRASVDETAPGKGLHNDPYLLSIRRSRVEEVRAIVKPNPRSDRRFAAVARVSEINLALYRSLWQPWLRALTTAESARWLQRWHPTRLPFEMWSDAHPLAPWVSKLAEQARQQRQPVSANNPFWQLQSAFSQAIEQALDRYRDQRDQAYATVFDALYDSPWLQALAGQVPADPTPARPHPGTTPEHQAFLRRARIWIEAQRDQGGLLEASLRALIYVFRQRDGVDERLYHAVSLMKRQLSQPLTFAEYRRLIREQAIILTYHGEAAIAAIPHLLEGVDAQKVEKAARAIADLVSSQDHGKDAAAVNNALRRVLEPFALAAATVSKHAPADKRPRAQPVRDKHPSGGEPSSGAPQGE